MARFWNKELRRILFVMTVIIMLGGAMINLALFQYKNTVRQNSYEVLARMTETVTREYPMVREEDVIKAITSNDTMEHGKNVLTRYGVFDNGEVLGLKQTESYFGWMINSIGIVVILCCIVTFLLFEKGRNQKLRELCHYVSRISLGKETLDIRSNEEDELSGLKNELYKLMISWREAAGNEKESKLALAEAVENISHQLKTPLTSVVVLVDNLLEDEQMNPQVQRKFLQEISRQLVGMKWLVVTLLKLSKFDAGVVELAKEPVSIKKALEDALQNLEINAQWKEIRFQTKLTDVRVMGDEKWLIEGFQNMIKNAMEYSPQKGIVEIETEVNDVFAQVVIRDHGSGIPEEAQKHLFERFYSNSKVENENMGIGLALSKEIIEKHNGYVTVNSGREGTEFVIKFLKHF